MPVWLTASGKNKFYFGSLLNKFSPPILEAGKGFRIKVSTGSQSFKGLFASQIVDVSRSALLEADLRAAVIAYISAAAHVDCQAVACPHRHVPRPADAYAGCLRAQVTCCVFPGAADADGLAVSLSRQG